MADLVLNNNSVVQICEIKCCLFGNLNLFNVQELDMLW